MSVLESGVRSTPASGRVLTVGGDELQTALEPLCSPSLGFTHCARLDGQLDPDLHDIVVADYDLMSSSERTWLIQRVRELEGRTRLLLVSERECRNDFPTLFSTHALTNLVARNGAVDDETLRVTVQKLLRPDIFGIGHYLPDTARVLSLDLTSSEEKQSVLERIEQFANSEGMKSWLVRLLSSVADEFITNAIYNAPVDSQGNHLYAHLPRSQSVQLPVQLGDPRCVRVRVAVDGRRVAISTIDPYGSLTPGKLMDYLAKCFRKGDDQVDAKAGGAGLGFYSVFEALTHFVVNLAPGRRTEMIGLVDQDRSYRQFASRNKSFNIFITHGL